MLFTRSKVGVLQPSKFVLPFDFKSGYYNVSLPFSSQKSSLAEVGGRTDQIESVLEGNRKRLLYGSPFFPTWDFHLSKTIKHSSGNR